MLNLCTKSEMNPDTTTIKNIPRRRFQLAETVSYWKYCILVNIGGDSWPKA